MRTTTNNIFHTRLALHSSSFLYGKAYGRCVA